MKKLLLRLFVKNYTDTRNPAVRTQYGKLAGITGIFCNLLLFAGKLVVGTLCKSVSITADAVNNLSDASSSVVTLLGFKFAGKPADPEHPYGHNRMEYLSGLCVAVMILLIGAELVKTSVARIVSPEPVEFSLAIVLVLVGSILLKLWMAGFNRSLGMAPDEHLVRQITDLLLAQDKVLGVHDLMIHDYGPGRRFASAHVEMDYREDVLDAHERIDELERQVRRELGVELVIHYDPIVTDDEELTRIHARVVEILKGVDPQLAVHDFRMVRGSRHTNVIFDMVLPFSMESRKQELRELVERELQTDGKQYHAVITFDMQAFNELPEKSVSPEKT